MTIKIIVPLVFTAILCHAADYFEVTEESSLFKLKLTGTPSTSAEAVISAPVIMQAYPNPCHGTIYVKAKGEAKLSSVILTSISGRKTTLHVNPSKYSFAISDEVASGIYFLSASETKGVSFRTRIIVLR